MLVHSFHITAKFSTSRISGM
uniref:Uncharacterized protein n=1 Tax=Arundo donax TaxID=35708 RepID=A0A0A9A0Z9_ARUDO